MRNLILFAALFLGIPCFAQGTFYTDSCNLADVRDCIFGTGANTCHTVSFSGPQATHTAADGDTINVKTGNCTWTGAGGQMGFPNNIGISLIGAGQATIAPGATTCTGATGGTCILDQQTSGSLISGTLTFGQSIDRVSNMTIVPASPRTGYSNPLFFGGICTGATTCPNVRLDHITIPQSWAGVGVPDNTFMVVQNVYGVADHNTVGDTSSSSGIGVNLVNVGHGQYGGNQAHGWGDDSWFLADSLGTNQAYYLENNTFTNSFGTDMDNVNFRFGGGRAVCRFNTFNQVSSGDACANHGTDTSGYLRGGRQLEFYGNSATCATNCNALAGTRSGVLYAFGNRITSGSANHVAAIDTQRRWRNDTPWGTCDGSGSWDTNDGTVYYNGTIGSVVNNGTTWTINDASVPGGFASVGGNPYSFHDTTNTSVGFEIVTSSAGTFTSGSSCADGSSCANNPAAGHHYQILRATSCIDQSTAGASNQITRTNLPNGTGPVPVAAISNALDPDYEWADSGTISNSISSATTSLVANRNFYQETIGQAAQSNPTTPFNGTTGVGHGTRANRPTTCTTGVGYYSTDQGSWNTNSVNFPGQTFSQGVLDICTSTNTWTNAVYTPFTYPHPLANTGPVISFSPQPLAFGTTPVGLTSNNLTLTISNVGTASLVISALNSPGAFPFELPGGTCGGTPITIAPGGSCTVFVAFTPGSVGFFSQNNTTTDNTSTNPSPVALTGTGTGPPAPTVTPFAGN